MFFQSRIAIACDHVEVDLCTNTTIHNDKEILDRKYVVKECFQNAVRRKSTKETTPSPTINFKKIEEPKNVL